MSEETDTPESVLDCRENEVRVGDTIAYASIIGRSATLSVSTVLGFVWHNDSWDASGKALKIKVQGEERHNRGTYQKGFGYLRAEYRRFILLERAA